jgi:murein DD-endopeptidase MepM/ murein hydrolase activator NlpD
MIDRSRIMVALFLLCFLLVFSTACQPIETEQFIPPSSTTIPNTHTQVPTNIPAEFPPKVKELKTAPEHPEIHNIDLPSSEATVEPLQVNFPIPQLETFSSWRPALYPVPLALTPFDHFYFSRPVAVNEISWPVEDYRYGGSFFEDVVHTGMDIKIPVGTPILAAGPGKVVWSGYGLFSGHYDPEDPYGQAVMIRHEFGFNGSPLYTVYAHLDRVDVVQDQYVEAGELLGLSGKTGKTSGPHLHIEVRLTQGDFFYTLNPELWLVPPQGWGVLAGKVMNTGGRKIEGQLVVIRSTQNEQFWRANSYHRGNVNSDPYYQENLVVSDLPAGRYEIVINYLSRIYTQEINIQPGLVSYFSFRGRNGFTTEPPPIPGGEFDPPQSP